MINLDHHSNSNSLCCRSLTHYVNSNHGWSYLFVLNNTYTKHAPYIMFKIKYEQRDTVESVYWFKILGKRLVYGVTFGERDYVTERLHYCQVKKAENNLWFFKSKIRKKNKRKRKRSHALATDIYGVLSSTCELSEAINQIILNSINKVRWCHRYFHYPHSLSFFSFCLHAIIHTIRQPPTATILPLFTLSSRGN
jgi:hypothetical protein